MAKHSDGSEVPRCIREDGSSTWQKQSRHAAQFAVHDLTHHAVKPRFVIDAGFWFDCPRLGPVAHRWDCWALAAVCYFSSCDEGSLEDAARAHRGAASGSADLVDLLLAHGHPADLVDPHYHSTALGFAIYDCTVEKRHPEGEFGRVVKSLIDAGSPWDALDYPAGDARIDNVLKPRMHQRVDGAALLGDAAALAGLLGESPGPDELTSALAGRCQRRTRRALPAFTKGWRAVNGSTGPDRVTPLMCAAPS